MGLILDLIFIAVIAVVAFIGYKRGLAKSLFGVLSFVASGIITMLIYKPVSSLIVKLPFVEKIIVSSEEKIQNLLGGPEQGLEKLPGWFAEVASKKAGEVAASISHSIVNVLVSIFCVIVIYILVKIALRIFEGVFESILKMRGLDTLNRVGGTVCGVLSAFVILWVVLAVVVLFAGTNLFAPVNEAIQSSFILKLFYNNNLFIKLIIG